MNMKNIQIILAIVCVELLATVASAEVVINAEIQKVINQILQTPVKIYQVDTIRQKEGLTRLDDLFEKQLDMKQAMQRINKKTTRTSYRQSMTNNQPLFVDAKAKSRSGVKAKREFNVIYIKKPMRRTFKKELIVLAAKALPPEEAIILGSKFIRDNHLCQETKNDKLGQAVVVARKRVPLDSKEAAKQIISQRMIFKRSFAGLNVINSKQTVEIHPETREVLGYKNIDWSPIQETTGKSMAMKSISDVLDNIRQEYKDRRKTYTNKVEQAMYQTDKQLIPVLLVYFETSEDLSVKGTPEEEVLIISLAKDLQLYKKEKKTVRPSKANK